MSVNSHFAFWLAVPAFAAIMALPVFAQRSGVPQIAYLCGPVTSYHVCLVDPDGSNPASIGPAITVGTYLPPAWSHDGAKIAFSNKSANSSGNSDIYAMDSKGANVTRLVDGSQFPNIVAPHNPQWSPDGSKIVFIDALNDGIRQYFTASTSGAGGAAQLTFITTQPGLSGGVSRPSWSPDGKQILAMFANPFPNYTLYSVDPGSGALTPISAGRYANAAWSPDGSQIVYTDNTSIFVMDKDGSNVRLVAVGGSSTNNVMWPSWSPDGSKIVFSTSATLQLFIVNADGSGLHAIPGVTGIFPDWQPLVSPIILIPGFLGSKIVCGAAELWPGLPIPGPDFLDMQLGPDGISNLVPGCGATVGGIVDTAIVPVYKPALDFLNQIAPSSNYNFPWDWRTSPANTISALDSFIDNVRKNNNGNKVVLMAHSMGGLLARWYIDDPSHAAKVDRLVTIGTPYWGSPKSLFPLAAGVEMPGFSPLDLFVNNSDLHSWAANALGLYFLYPSANYGPWLTVTDKSPNPLGLTGLLDYVGNTLGGNAALLGQALSGHANTLDGFKTNGVKYRVVAGTGLNTVGAVNIHPLDANGRNIDLTLISGDQTVPGISANQGPLGSQAPLGEAVPIYYACNVGHTDLPGDPTVTQAIKDFLLTGGDIKGLDTPCTAAGFEIDVIQILTGHVSPTALAASPAPMPESSTPQLSLANAELAGLIDVFRFPTQTTIVTDSVKPVFFQLPPGSFRLIVTPLQNGAKESPSFYGPLNGTITVSADTAVIVFQNGVVVQPGATDTIPPSTSPSVSPTPISGWNKTDGTVTLTATDNPGGSGVSKITYSASGAQTISSTVVNSSTASFPITAAGVTTVSFFAQDNAGNLESTKTLTVRIDRTPPRIVCGAASLSWSATNASISCTASDADSGLASATDASFSLTTTVPDGTETSNALTNSRIVCDVAANCSTAGPIGGNKIDRKPPSIAITAPSAGVYLLNQIVAANYACSDGGSGLASCTGTVASGARLNTSTVGTRIFTVIATDALGNTVQQSVTITVAYNVCLQYDPATPSPAGAANPIRIKLCDGAGADVGSPAIAVTATGVLPSGELQSPGNSYPGNVFKFDAAGYQFVLDTTGYSPGSYALQFIAAGDPITHLAAFQLK